MDERYEVNTSQTEHDSNGVEYLAVWDRKRLCDVLDAAGQVMWYRADTVAGVVAEMNEWDSKHRQDA